MNQLPFPIAPDPEDAAREAGHKLFLGPVDFVKGVVAMSGLPPDDRTEICFAGRSNVGKSSLINALTGRKTLARTSNTPGRTKELNFFELGPQGQAAVMLVDLPGYGYARETKARVGEWTQLVMSYLRGRAQLRRRAHPNKRDNGPKTRKLNVVETRDRDPQHHAREQTHLVPRNRPR